MLHLRDEIGEEEHLAVARAGDERVLRITRVGDEESRVLDPVFSAHALKIGLPALAVRWIAQHEVKLTTTEGVIGERRVLGPADDVVRFRSFTFE